MQDSKVAKPERLYGCNYCGYRTKEGSQCPYCGRPLKLVSELVNT